MDRANPTSADDGDRLRTERLRAVVERARTLPFYRERLDGVDAARLAPDDLSALPFVTRGDLTAHLAADPTGGFADGAVQMHLTPAPGGRMPEFLGRGDLDRQADATRAMFARCGVRAGDRCLVVFSYHMLAGGWLLHQGLIELGALVLPLGPAGAEQVAEILSTYEFDVLVGNPSFARKIGEAGGRVASFVASGEPFTAVPGYRERVEAALGCRAYDAYALSETGVVAAETAARDGLWPVEEGCVLEVVDPQTLAPVADGEKGELVVTSLTREAMPILRFRTGDLTLRGSRNGRLVLPRGVFGRTDSMVKVKGVKVYPGEFLFLLAGTPGLNFRAYQLIVGSREDGTDRVTLRVEGEPGTDTRELAARLRAATGVAMNAIEVAERVEGERVVDERFG